MDQTLQQLRARRVSRLAIAIVAAILSLPIALGFGFTLAAAFNYAPVLGRDDFGLVAFRDLFATAGFTRALFLSVWTGVISTFIAIVLAISVVAHSPRVPRLIAPLLATPHAAIALGIAFLFAPTGALVRIIFAPLGFDTPPQITTINDPWAMAIIVALVIKELPFLILVLFSARDQLPVGRYNMIARSMGYSAFGTFTRIILPQIYPLVRLPIFAVLGFAIGVVDVAIILGPSTPPTLAVATVQWYNDPNLDFYFMASASAVVIAAITVVVLLLAWLSENLVIRILVGRASRGSRHSYDWLFARLGDLGRAALYIGVAGIVMMFIWSISFRWPFPNILPTEWSLRAWTRHSDGLIEASATSMIIGASATLLAFIFAVIWLEAETHIAKFNANLSNAIIYLPLVAPQISFLFGINVLFLRSGVNNGLLAVIWGHAIFVFPYIMITMADPWRQFDQRYIQGAQSMGIPTWRRLLRVKMPILSTSIITALAIGFAVSIAQYLPTLFMGAGRVETLTTEAVALASGGDRRIAGAFGFLQAALPLVVYAIARYWMHNRRLKMGLDL